MTSYDHPNHIYKQMMFRTEEDRSLNIYFLIAKVEVFQYKKGRLIAGDQRGRNLKSRNSVLSNIYKERANYRTCSRGMFELPKLRVFREASEAN